MAGREKKIGPRAAAHPVTAAVNVISGCASLFANIHVKGSFKSNKTAPFSATREMATLLPERIESLSFVAAFKAQMTPVTALCCELDGTRVSAVKETRLL